MSNKSGISSQVITVPKGGGALHGIGEKFSPDLHTGTGNFTVPIALPPGRNGFQPQLNLVYSTGQGNGPFGLGWGLSIPGISRKTSKGIPLYDDSIDVFLLSGSEDLIPVSTELDGIISYKPRTEGLFALIYHHRDTDNNYWEVHSKDGLISLYGTPGAAGKDHAVIANPDPLKRHNIFSWRLSKTVDSFGNCIEYEYMRDLGEDGPHNWDQIYLRQIRYIDYISNGETKFLVSVTFQYENRPDPFSEYRSGFEIRTRKRCTSIEVRTHAEKEHLVRVYNLIYLDQKQDNEQFLPLNGVSLLSEIKVIGYNEERSEELPPLEFGYTQFKPEGRDFSPLKGQEMPPFSLANPNLELADLFGNGLPDILEINGTCRYWRNLGNGCFDLPRNMKEAPGGFRLADPGVQLIDADGDGKLDLLVTIANIAGYYPLRFGGLWDKRSFKKYKIAPSFNLEDPEVKLMDIDGDGVTDALRTGTRLEYYFNNPEIGWNRTIQIERRALEVFPNINFSDTRVKLADMTGDGLQDIVLIYDGNIEYWPNLGHGNWGKQIFMRNSPRFPYGYDPRRILIGDVDGDGLADVVYVDDTKVTLWINQCGNSWSNPIEIIGTPPVSDLDAVRLADMLGNGISGILWSKDAILSSKENYYFLDFTGGVKPYLMNQMNNNIGAVTLVEYASSTKFYLADEKRPEARWKTTMPFPVQVVARVEVIDEISKGKLTTEYHYNHGYWDGAEGEFRGFGRVDQKDTETFENYHSLGLHQGDKDFQNIPIHAFSPPLETRTWFHQGPIGDEFGNWQETDFNSEFWPGDKQAFSRPQSNIDFLKALPRHDMRDALRALRGNILRSELYALDSSERQDRPYTVTESQYGIREEAYLGPDEEGRLRIFFPYILAQRTTQWERGDDPLTQLKFTDDYDEYGQPCTSINIAVPRGRDFRKASDSNEDPYLITYSMIDYASRPDLRYIVDRVAKTTSYEVINDGELMGEPRPSAFDLVEAIKIGIARKEVIGQTLRFYDGLPFQGLPFGDIGEHGALVRTEGLVLTDEILQRACANGNKVGETFGIPPYLIHDEPIAWNDDYPLEFRNLPALAGYVYHEPSEEYEAGYYAVTERRSYDFQNQQGLGRGLLKATLDPLGHETSIDYDSFDLFPITVTDPAGMKTQAIYDYRVMQPCDIKDPNGNRSAFIFTPLGLLEATAVMGKVDENIGDTLEVPGTRLTYDFLAFINRGQPISVRGIKRIHHVNDMNIPLPERDETIETVEYSDGFGRLLQTRTQGEDAIFGDATFGNQVLPRDQGNINDTAEVHAIVPTEPNEKPFVIVSGWQIYDNKGRVVEKYEPFFSEGWDYVQPEDSLLKKSQKALMFYDPRGHVICTVNPDNSEQIVVYGTPIDLTDSAQFSPNPWEIYTYDANDNAGRTHPSEAKGFDHHWNTPSNAVVDALGRTVEAVARNREKNDDGSLSPIEEYRTKSKYDIRGNLIEVVDPLNRVAFRYTYDLANHPLRIESIDAGIHVNAMDAIGNAVELRDSKGAVKLQAYDILNRPIWLWARDQSGQAVTLRECIFYGDQPDSGMSLDTATSRNALGKSYKHYDEAGLQVFEAYDFKGNILEKSRQVIKDDLILSVFESAPANDWKIEAFRVDWQPHDGRIIEEYSSDILDAANYQTSLTYDALNRIKSAVYPQDVEGSRRELRPHYNRAGALEKVELNGVIYIENIAYNAKRLRTMVAYGNGIITRYVYDEKTFRLIRMRTESYIKPNTFTYSPFGKTLQDFAYDYDLAGNMLALYDRTPDGGVPSTPLGKDALNREFVYDALYRLISATGREGEISSLQPLWDDIPRSNDSTLTRCYKEEYCYDPVGNISKLMHASTSNGFTREFSIAPGKNRLSRVNISQKIYSYTYDASGNLIQENTARHFEWDYSDRLKTFRTQLDGSEPSVYAYYLYDSSGQRVKKLIRKQGEETEVTIYIDDIFEYHQHINANSKQKNNDLQVMDNQNRIALVRVGNPFTGDMTPKIKYHLSDHLGSSNIVVDNSGSWISYEEFLPYGETSFGSFSHKRYRFTGKERDEESGFYYHGARYYAPWLAKWTSVDPAGMVDGPNLYAYAKGKPISLRDPNGLDSEEPSNVKTESTFHAAPVSHVSPPPPPVPGTPAAAYAEGRRIGERFGDLLGRYEGALNTLQTKWGGVSVWDRMSEREKIEWSNNALMQFDKLPQLPNYDRPENAAAAHEGYLVGAESGFSGARFRNFVLKIGGEAAILLTIALEARLAVGLATRIPRLMTIYRVEGMPNTRLLVGRNGEVVIIGEKMLFLNFGSKARAEQYFAQKIQGGLPGAQIKSFEVPKTLLETMRAVAVPQRLGRQFPNRPQIVDATRAADQFGLRTEMIDLLQKLILQGSGKASGN